MDDFQEVLEKNLDSATEICYLIALGLFPKGVQIENNLQVLVPKQKISHSESSGMPKNSPLFKKLFSDFFR